MPPSDAAWQQKLAALRAHVAAHGRLPPNSDASGLGKWVSEQRRAEKGTKMTSERAAALELVPGWAWEVDVQAAWEEKLAALRAHVAAHGRLPPQLDAAGLSPRCARTSPRTGGCRRSSMLPASACGLPPSGRPKRRSKQAGRSASV